jgi:hypothetical protein
MAPRCQQRLGRLVSAPTGTGTAAASPATVVGIGQSRTGSAGELRRSPATVVGAGLVPALTVTGAAVASPAAVVGVGLVPAPSPGGQPPHTPLVTQGRRRACCLGYCYDIARHGGRYRVVPRATGSVFVPHPASRHRHRACPCPTVTGTAVAPATVVGIGLVPAPTARAMHGGAHGGCWYRGRASRRQSSSPHSLRRSSASAWCQPIGLRFQHRFPPRSSARLVPLRQPRARPRLFLLWWWVPGWCQRRRQRATRLPACHGGRRWVCPACNGQRFRHGVACDCRWVGPCRLRPRPEPQPLLDPVAGIGRSRPDDQRVPGRVPRCCRGSGVSPACDLDRQRDSSPSAVAVGTVPPSQLRAQRTPRQQRAGTGSVPQRSPQAQPQHCRPGGRHRQRPSASATGGSTATATPLVFRRHLGSPAAAATLRLRQRGCRHRHGSARNGVRVRHGFPGCRGWIGAVNAPPLRYGISIGGYGRRSVPSTPRQQRARPLLCLQPLQASAQSRQPPHPLQQPRPAAVAGTAAITTPTGTGTANTTPRSLASEAFRLQQRSVRRLEPLRPAWLPGSPRSRRRSRAVLHSPPRRRWLAPGRSRPAWRPAPPVPSEPPSSGRDRSHPSRPAALPQPLHPLWQASALCHPLRLGVLPPLPQPPWLEWDRSRPHRQPEAPPLPPRRSLCRASRRSWHRQPAARRRPAPTPRQASGAFRLRQPSAASRPRRSRRRSRVSAQSHH